MEVSVIAVRNFLALFLNIKIVRLDEFSQDTNLSSNEVTFIVELLILTIF